MFLFTDNNQQPPIKDIYNANVTRKYIKPKQCRDQSCLCLCELKNFEDKYENIDIAERTFDTNTIVQCNGKTLCSRYKDIETIKGDYLSHVFFVEKAGLPNEMVVGDPDKFELYINYVSNNVCLSRVIETCQGAFN